jgi:Flp pilus assembly protein TadG
MRLRSVVRRAVGDDGQALVEFALVVPLLLLLLVGIIEFARAWNEHQVLTDATREGARRASVYDPTVTADSIRSVIEGTLASNGMTADSIQLQNWDGASGTPVTVHVVVPYRFVFLGPLAQWATGESDILLRSTFTMRNE